MAASSDEQGPIERVATRLAALLRDGGGGIDDPTGSGLTFEAELTVRPLARAPSPPSEVWAVDGGQALVADARCVQVYATRAARVRWRPGQPTLEEQLPLEVHLLGMGEEGPTRTSLGAPVAADCTVDINLLRDWAEWSAASDCVAAAQPGALVLVDGDLQPDWRLAPGWAASLMDTAADRGVALVGVTKHTSLAWGRAPLLGVVERLGADELGPRSCWWAPVARRDPSVGPGVQVLVAKLDPDARFSFRIDLPADVDPGPALGLLSAVSDDAAFPGYPFPLTAADRLAACPGWVRDEVWGRIDDLLASAGVADDIRDRAFTDRHRLMERS